jgi:hypothetical protein
LHLFLKSKIRLEIFKADFKFLKVILFLFLQIQFTVFSAVTKINYQPNQQPNRKINPIPNTKFRHHIQARN